MGEDRVDEAELAHCSILGFGGIVAALGQWSAGAEAAETRIDLVN